MFVFKITQVSFLLEYWGKKVESREINSVFLQLVLASVFLDYLYEGCHFLFFFFFSNALKSGFGLLP